MVVALLVLLVLPRLIIMLVLQVLHVIIVAKVRTTLASIDGIYRVKTLFGVASAVCAGVRLLDFHH